LSVYAVDTLIAQARKLASDYRKTMDKPLAGISSEIAEYDAVHLLDLEACKPAVNGYDAIGKGSREGKRVQIKGRVISKGKAAGQRVGQIKLDQDWDIVVLVILTEEYEPHEIYEVSHEAIKADHEKVGEGPRSKRGAMSVAKFKAIGRLAWSHENGLIDTAEK